MYAVMAGAVGHHQAVLYDDYHLVTVCLVSVYPISCCLISKLMHYALRAITFHML